MSVRISDTDNAIATRDKLIDDQRRKIDEYKYKYYNALDEADKANHDFDELQEKFDKLFYEHRNLQQRYQNLKEDSNEDRKGFDMYAEKVENDMKEKMEENKDLKEKLNNAKINIKELNENMEEKDLQISALKQLSMSKVTSETQTSFQEELIAKNVNKFSKEKNDLLSKFTSLQSKINLQVDNLSKSIRTLKQKSQVEKCYFGWKCARKFCKYSHEHLYSFNKSLGSKCDKTFETVNHQEHHIENLHEDFHKESTNLDCTNSNVRKQKVAAQDIEKIEEVKSCTSSSLSDTLSRTSSSSSTSSLSTSNSEREEVGGVSRSNTDEL